MNSFKIHLGYTQQFQPFEFDLTKYPSLFVNYNNSKRFTENDPVTISFINAAKEQDKKEKYLKTVVIDNGIVDYCSAVHKFEYKKRDPEAMMKRMHSTINKIYDNYLHNPDFVPYTKYLIIVKDTKGLEQYLVDIMSKIGPIGVYLIFNGGNELVETYPHIKHYLFGQVIYNDNFVGKYHNIRWGSSYDLTLERFRPETSRSPVIYPDYYYNALCKSIIESDDLFS